jgi:hypothetical protein
MGVDSLGALVFSTQGKNSEKAELSTTLLNLSILIKLVYLNEIPFKCVVVVTLIYSLDNSQIRRLLKKCPNIISSIRKERWRWKEILWRRIGNQNLGIPKLFKSWSQ